MPRPSTGLNSASRKLPDGTTEHTWYHRATKRLIGRSRDGWTKATAAQRARELDGEAPAGPATGSFGELCTLYLASPAYTKLAPKTRKGYRAQIDTLRLMWNAVPIEGISRRAVRAVHQQYEDRPWQGNAILRTLRLVMNHGLDEVEMPGLTRNPAARTAHYETLPRTQVWDQPRIDAFLAAAPPTLRLAFALLLYTVQRPGDMLQMVRPMLREAEGRTWIRLRQAKTDELVDVPCHERLIEVMAAGAAHDSEAVTRLRPGAGSKKAGQVAAPARLVASPRGKAWSYRNFARAWDKTRAAANWRLAREAIKVMGGLPHEPKARAEAKASVRVRLLTGLQRRDLRRTGMVQLALAGATVPQIAALTGWRIEHAQNIVDTYLPRRGEVALGGVERWEADKGRVVVLAGKRQGCI